MIYFFICRNYLLNLLNEWKVTTRVPNYRIISSISSQIEHAKKVEPVIIRDGTGCTKFLELNSEFRWIYIGSIEIRGPAFSGGLGGSTIFGVYSRQGYTGEIQVLYTNKEEHFQDQYTIQVFFNKNTGPVLSITGALISGIKARIQVQYSYNTGNYGFAVFFSKLCSG